jgi:hypothetical protein
MLAVTLALLAAGGDLPDPLLGVERAEQWPARRAEIRALFVEHVYGPLPPAPASQTFEVRSEVDDAMGGRATRREIRVVFGPHPDDHADLLVYVPSERTDPVPMLLGLNFYGNHSVEADERITLSQRWLPSRAAGVVENRATEAARGTAAARWPIALALERGYGVATVYHGDFDPDRRDGHRWRDAHGSPTLSVWAWGLQRAMDALEREPAVDATRVVLFGHSRNGKTALWAGANDERFAVVVSNQSGCCGAALSRRDVGESVERIQRVFPHWFCDRLAEYAGRPETLPVDQHELIALIAPRPVLVCSAEDDTWADPKGERLALDAAAPVYELLGFDESSGRRGYHIRPGGHAIGAADWTAFMDFAERQLRTSGSSTAPRGR